LISIVFTEGPRAGERVQLDREMTFGRIDCDVTLDDHQVSRRHLKLTPAGEDLHIEDLGSSNGTRVNGYRIAEAVSIGDGAAISLGTSEFILEVSAPQTGMAGSPPPPAAAPAAAAPAAMAAGGGLPQPLWILITLVEIAVILTAATLLVYYAVS
jgi:hypothetical protein